MKGQIADLIEQLDWDIFQSMLTLRSDFATVCYTETFSLTFSLLIHVFVQNIYSQVKFDLTNVLYYQT